MREVDQPDRTVTPAEPETIANITKLEKLATGTSECLRDAGKSPFTPMSLPPPTERSTKRDHRKPDRETNWYADHLGSSAEFIMCFFFFLRNSTPAKFRICLPNHPSINQVGRLLTRFMSNIKPLCGERALGNAPADCVREV
ncbi:hypothetical protein VTG60DRAFT_2526 [Thermothelomyces hinnuleus]